eukprot:jgi/Psemu1/59000/gm1.59000_g
MSRKLSSRSCKKASDEADRVVAATAGRENWQTWAGRKHGTEDFEYLDVFRGMKRTFNDRFRSKVPVAGTTCPVCFCEPDDPSMWYVTWCGHGICKDCLAQYAASQVGDQEQSGPLTCPVCLKTLRERDAFAALTAGDNRNELIEKWDLKTRNQLLRAIPSFRTCPKCGGSDSIGGGFVTPDCLAPQHDERRQAATQILMNRNVGLLGLLVSYFVLVGIIHSNKSPSVRLDFYCMILPLSVFFKLAMAMHFWLAGMAKKELLRPIAVECPCCDEKFVLPTESAHLADEETSKW